MDDTYNKIVRQNVMKDDNISKHRIQTALKSFTYTCLDFLDFSKKSLVSIRNELEYYVI